MVQVNYGRQFSGGNMDSASSSHFLVIIYKDVGILVTAFVTVMAFKGRYACSSQNLIFFISFRMPNSIYICGWKI